MKPRLRYGLIGAATFAALLVAASFLLPGSVYKGEIELGVTRATGRTFTISGPIHFTLLPILGLRADKVALANMPGGHAASALTADDIRIGVRLWPLLLGRIEVSQIVLDRPLINLEVDPEGHANWVPERSHAVGDGRPSHFSVNAHFSGLRIVDGRVDFSNRHTGKTCTIEHLDSVIGFSDPDRPVFGKGRFTLSGRHGEFTARVTAGQRLLRDKTIHIDASLASEHLAANYAGSIAPDGSLRGSVRIRTSMLQRDASWLNLRLPRTAGLNALDLKGRIESGAHIISLSDATLTLDTMHMQGDIAIEDGGDRPALRGIMTADHIDLNPYIRTAHPSGKTRSHRQNEGWSDVPINLDILKSVDADLTLNAGSLDVEKLKLGRTKIRAMLNAGRLTAQLDPLVLYGGSGKAVVDIDAHGAAPVFRNTLQFNNIAVQPFFSDAIGVKQIEGMGTIALDIASSGDNPDAIMRGIHGKGSIAFRDGRLRGVDLGAVARTIQSLIATAAGPDALTQYRAMTGSFVISRGVLANQDFRLEGPLLSMTGSGTVDIGNRAIDFKIVPRATASVAHQKLTIGVPFKIRGPWRHVRYAADVSGLVKGVLENLEAGRAPFKGLLGNSSPKTGDKKKKHKSMGDALKNMFGIH